MDWPHTNRRLRGFARAIKAERGEEPIARILPILLQRLPDSVLIADRNAVIRYVNPAFERLTGYSSSEVVGQNAQALKSGRQPGSLYQSMWQVLQQGQFWRGRLDDRKKDGTTFTCDLTITPIRDADEQVLAYVAFLRDVTSEVRTQEEQLRATQMESLSRIAGGLAHDVNNATTVVLGYASLALEEAKDTPSLRGLLEQILDAAEQTAHTTRQLVAFSAHEAVDMGRVEVNAIVAQCENAMCHLLGGRGEMKTALCEESTGVTATPSLLRHVLINLVSNARNALSEDGGRVLVSTGIARTSDLPAPWREEARASEYVLLAVRDTGRGMDQDHLARIFELHCPDGAGLRTSGLGLPVTYGIVRKLNGFIRVDSQPAAGTEVRIWLPRISVPETALRVEIEEALPRGLETILYAEDDVAVRNATTRMLRSLGYTVLEVSDGMQALSLLDKYEGPVDMLLIDVVMPKMSGPEMVRQMPSQFADAVVVYTSGATDTFTMDRDGLLRMAAFLEKPYGYETLARAIRDALESRKQSRRSGDA